MKRYNNLFDKIVSLDNLYLADKKARRNKSSRKDIKEFDQNKEELLKEAKDEYNVNSLDELREYRKEKHAENEKIIADYSAYVEEQENIINAANEKMNDINN